MSILVNKNTRAIVQGFTGREGTFHARQCLDYGTQIVGGVTPGKGGKTHLGLPVFDTVAQAVHATKATASLIFVPPLLCADAMMEAADAGISLVITITEGIPIRDMIRVKAFFRRKGVALVGPNCPGIITSEECKLGIMPGSIFKKGPIGLLSKSGTLTYEASHQIAQANLGISTAIGIGGDPIMGLSYVDLLPLFESDDQTKAIVLIGEIGGDLEIQAANFIRNNIKKPVVAFIAGQMAPKDKRMGHAGAIVSGSAGSAKEKMKALREAGAHVVESPADIGKIVKSIVS